jgi:mRNA-degrading endonuclease toxin of MazEF toxin-antitoxin module
MPIKEGDIFWVNIPKSQTKGSEQFDPRPYIIVSRTGLNNGRTVVGVPLSSQTRKAGQHRTLVPAGEIIKDQSYTRVPLDIAWH